MQIMSLIKIKANIHSGMKDQSTIRLVEALLIRIVYVAPYLMWQVAEKTKLECPIHKVYKLAIGLPINTGTEHLLQLKFTTLWKGSLKHSK